MYIGSLGSLSSASSLKCYRKFLIFWDFTFETKLCHTLFQCFQSGLKQQICGCCTLKRAWSEEVCWRRVTVHLGFLSFGKQKYEREQWINRGRREKVDIKIWIVSLGALPEERKSQVGLGSVRNGASSSICKLCLNFIQISLFLFLTEMTRI